MAVDFGALRAALDSLGAEILERKRLNGWTLTESHHWRDENKIPADLMTTAAGSATGCHGPNHERSHMKILCNRESLLAAHSLVSGVIPSRSPKPVLMNAKLVATADGLTLMGTDLEVGVRHRADRIDVREPGEALLPASVGQILRASTDAELEIESDGETLSVRGVRSSWDLPTEDPTLYPEVPGFDAAAWHVVEAAALRKAIALTVFATDAESMRYALGGVLFEFDASTVAMIATDGRRLARVEVEASVDGSGEPERPASAVVPVKTLKLIARHLDDGDAPVHLAFPAGGNAVLVRTGSAVIYSRLVEGRFPRYQDVFPASCEARVPVEAGPLRSAVEQAAIVSSEDSRGIDLAFGSGLLRLSRVATEKGQSRVELPIDREGPEITVSIDHRYAVEPLKVLGDMTIVVELVDAKSPVVFRADAERYVYVAMPLTREQ